MGGFSLTLISTYNLSLFLENSYVFNTYLWSLFVCLLWFKIIIGRSNIRSNGFFCCEVIIHRDNAWILVCNTYELKIRCCAIGYSATTVLAPSNVHNCVNLYVLKGVWFEQLKWQVKRKPYWERHLPQKLQINCEYKLRTESFSIQELSLLRLIHLFRVRISLDRLLAPVLPNRIQCSKGLTSTHDVVLKRIGATVLCVFLVRMTDSK